MKHLIFPTLLLLTVLCLEFKYHTNEELERYLHNYIERFPGISRLYSIGKSTDGVELWVVQVSATKPDSLAPHVKLIGNIHGNEAVGREILLQLIEFLGMQYPKNKEVTWLLNNTNLHILPTMNPDGFNISCMGICMTNLGRPNKNGIDLNRNFPGVFYKNLGDEQAETIAVRKWMEEYTFTLSASLHTGALVANYPYDSEKESISKLSNVPSVAPDNDVFQFLAASYANEHSTMHTGDHCEMRFPGGITNGAQWYSFSGGMQDYNYMKGCMELTLEISCCKYPLTSELPKLWDENKNALLNFSSIAHNGLKGILCHKKNRKRLASAEMKIAGRETPFYTSKEGEFWRILLPGSYNLEVRYFNRTYPKIPFNVYEKKPTIMEIYITTDDISVVMEKSTTLHPNDPTKTSTATTETKQSTNPVTEAVISRPAEITIGNNLIPSKGSILLTNQILLLICTFVNN